MLPAGATPVLYKTDSQGAWQRIDGAVVGAGSVSAQVTSFSFFLVGNLPPQIAQQPQDASVAEPNMATFSVTALGTPPFSYQWQRSDDGGVTFSDVGSGASFTTPSHVGRQRQRRPLPRHRQQPRRQLDQQRRDVECRRGLRRRPRRGASR